MRKRTIGLLVLALVCLALPALGQEAAEPAGRPAGTWGAGALGAAFLLGIATPARPGPSGR